MLPTLAFETDPYYAQVALFDPEVSDAYPNWVTGEEEVVFGPSGVAVATRPDEAGPVRIEVYVGSYEPDPSWRFVGDGMVRVTARRLVVGSVTGGDLRSVPTDPGEYRVSVHFHDGEGGPDAVAFVVRAL